jgi:hypothetical protein
MRLGLPQRVAQPALGFADVAIVQRADVHPQQRLLPGRCDRLRAQALARPLDTEHQHAARLRQSEPRRLIGQCILPLFQPALQPPQTADFHQADRRLDVLQQPALLQHPPFRRHDGVDVVLVEPAIVRDRVGDDAGRLPARQAAQVADDRAQAAARDIDLDRPLTIRLPQSVDDELLQLLLVRQRQVVTGCVAGNHRRQLFLIIDQHELTAGAPQAVQQVPQYAQRPIVAQVAGQIERDTQGVRRQMRKVGQSGDRRLRRGNRHALLSKPSCTPPLTDHSHSGRFICRLSSRSTPSA